MSHRATSVSVACLATASFMLCFVAGLSCSFVEINPEPERLLMTPGPDGIELEDVPEAFFGVLCVTSPFYTEEDRMWWLSQIFWYVGLVLGGLTAVVAWTLSVCTPPTNAVWRSISFLGAGAAVMQIPIFLIFESEPCNMDINRQNCQMAPGAYMNIISIAFFVILTLWTQLVSPPDWTKEIDSWRRQGSSSFQDRDVKLGEISIPSGGDSREGTEAETAPRESPQSSNAVDTEEPTPRPPTYWHVERKRVEERYPLPAAMPEEEEEMDADEESTVEKDLAMSHNEIDDATARGSTVQESVAEEVKETKPRSSLWKGASLFGLATRRQKDDDDDDAAKKTIKEKAIGRQDSRLTQDNATRASSGPLEPEGMSPVPEQDPQDPLYHTIEGLMSWDSRDIEVAAQPARASGQGTNRNVSLLGATSDNHSNDAQSSSLVLPPPPTAAKQPQEEESKKKRFSLAGLSSRFKLSSRDSALDGKSKAEKPLKVTIICPDGTEEKRQMGYPTMTHPAEEEEEGEEPDAPDDELQSDRSHLTGSRSGNETPSPMAARDFVVTHSMGNTSRVVATQSARLRSSPLRTSNARRSPTETPLESFQVMHSMSYDDAVSEMTPGPLEVKDDTLAILQDLRRFED